jgi:hypothetical protein
MGMLLMCGMIFTVIGGFLSYIAFWVINERLIDDHLGRDGTPVSIIAIIVLATTLCLSGGLSSLFGAKWFIRLLLLVGIFLGGARLDSNR